MIAVVVLATLIALVFVTLGTAKIRALAPMRERAAKAGFSTAAYRRIGVLEVAGAAGVALGPLVPPLGVAAGTGLLALMAGALVVHVRKGDSVPELAPAVFCALTVAGYLAALPGAT